VRVERAYTRIYKGPTESRFDLCRSIVTMVQPPRVAPVKGPDPKLRNEFCPQVSPSQVRDASGPHDGNEHTLRAIVSDGVHSVQTMWSRRSLLQLPTQRSAMPFCQGLRNEVRLGIILVAFTAAITSNPNF
jgi:hypothetical protein